MSCRTRRALAVTAAAGSLVLLALEPSAPALAAPAPIPPRNVIAVPSPEQISSIVDASRCPWLKAYLTALTGGLTGVANADRHPVAPGVASGFALLIAASLVAAQYGMAGG